jgi:hypothetical protein
MWDSVHKELGRLKENNSINIYYRFEGPVPFEVTKLVSSCGCTTPKFDKETGILSVVFNTKRIPKHLEWQGEYTTTKKITMTTDIGTFSFTFKATIVKK